MIKNNKLILNYNNDSIKKKIGEILRYVYHYFELDHDRMLEYYDEVEAPMDYDHFTDEKDLHTYIKFWSNHKKDEKYFYGTPNEFDGKWYDDYPKLINEINDFIEKKSTKLLKLNGVTKIILVNNLGKYNCVNHDSRGVRKADWKLYTWDKFEIENSKGINFNDLIIACYKIKSHKFENNYELYCDVVSIEIVDTTLQISVSFDHGS